MVQRAQAREAMAKMHAGFANLRNLAPMNLRASYPGRVDQSAIANDMLVLENLLGGLLQNSTGEFLFGDFCAADAMFAPVAVRVKTYDLAVSPQLSEYFAAIFSLEAFAQWREAALAESWIVAEDEID